MFDRITEWMSLHSPLLIWMTGISVVMFFSTLLLIPVLVIRIPEDYFIDKRRHSVEKSGRNRVLFFGGLLLKNLLGLVFILAGIAMLFLPGQGILSILIGMTLSNFPGKYRLERRLVLLPRVLQSINWLRERRGRNPLSVMP